MRLHVQKVGQAMEIAPYESGDKCVSCSDLFGRQLALGEAPGCELHVVLQFQETPRYLWVLLNDTDNK